MEITKEEKEYYDKCVEIYGELSNTKLLESLKDLREQIINRVARLDDEKKVWKELGKLWVIDHLIGRKQHLYNEVKRVETLMEEV